MKLATQDKPFFPDGYEQKLQTVKSMGFEGFEVDGKVLIDRFDEIKDAIKTTGVPIISACGGYNGWIGDFDDEKRQNGLAEISEILRHLSEIGGKGIVIPAAWGMFSKRLPPMTPPRTDQEDKQVLLDSLTQLNKVAKETKTYVYLEPLNRYEDYMINRLEDAVSLIKEGSFSNVKVIGDFFHMNIEEPDIAKSLHINKDYIGHIHVSDSHRYQPGDGHLDFVSGFKALRDIGYSGYLAFECRVLGTPEDELYKESVKYIQGCLEESR